MYVIYCIQSLFKNRKNPMNQNRQETDVNDNGAPKLWDLKGNIN